MADDKKSIRDIWAACSALSAQANSLLKDKKPVPENIKTALASGFKEIIDFEKMYLISAHDRFYGSLLMNIDTDIDFKQRGPVDIKIDNDNFTLTVNPLWCGDYSFPEFTGLVVQDLLKLAFMHPSTYKSINSENDPKKHNRLERASNASVSSMVQHDIRLTNSGSGRGLRLPKDAYTTSTISSELGVLAKDNQSIEYYYKLINNFSKKGNESNGDSNKNGAGNGQMGSGQGNGGMASPENGEGDSVHQWEGQGSDDLEESIKALVHQVWDSLSDEQRGLVPGALAEQIKKMLAPPQINWKQILRKMVGAIPIPYRKTRTRLNRRQPYRSDLSGRLPKRTVNVVVGIDTSGSVSNKEIEYFVNEILNILKDFKGSKLTIVECDAEIGRIYSPKNIAQVDNKVTGRGGTCFTPVVEYVNGEKKYLNDPKKYPDAGKYRNALFVYFTDGFGEYEIPKPMTYRNLWVVLHDVKNLSVKEPYGDVVSIRTDEKYMSMFN